MPRKIIQILGTSSNCGKTTIATGLCRSLSNMGYSVSPFKAVNMSLNSVAIAESVEISRSVVLQSMAARVSPEKEMNPFLLKPEADGKAQLIRLGRSLGVMAYSEYGEILRDSGKEVVASSLESLSDNHDVVIAEGAGSAGEINFKGRDLANSFVSSIFGTPAILVGDIDRGGVFASMLGTYELMEFPNVLKWMVINKMRGNPSLLRGGIMEIEKRMETTFLGALQHSSDIVLPGEDSLDYEQPPTIGGDIAVIRYPYMENQSDLDPLILGDVGFTYVDGRNMELLDRAKAVILPGSKDVFEDLRYLKKAGLDEKIIEFADSGKTVLGICGGYQILCREIRRNSDRALGLSLLDADAEYNQEKTVRTVNVSFNTDLFKSSEQVKGYMIHYGQILPRSGDPLFKGEFGQEGIISANGNVIGTNVHGMLENRYFAEKILGVERLKGNYASILDRNIEKLSRALNSALDIDKIVEYLETT